MAIRISGTTVIDDSRNFTNIQEINGLEYPSTDGSAGQVLTTDGAGSLSLQNPDSISPSIEAVASGTLPDGSPVVVNSDGTVSVIEESESSSSAPEIYSSGFPINASMAFDSNENKIVIGYKEANNSNRGTVIVGDVVGESITFGSPVTFTSGAVDLFSLTFDSNENKVVIFYRDENNSNFGTARVATVSGTSITVGSPVVFESNTTEVQSSQFDVSTNKVIVYYGINNRSNAILKVATVSGSSISFGSGTSFANSGFDDSASTFDSNTNSIIAIYRDSGNSNFGTCVIGTINGTSVSIGSPIVFVSVDVTDLAATFDSNENKVVITYNDGANSGYGTAIVGDVTGNSITFGNPTVFNTSSSNDMSAAFDTNLNTIGIFFRSSSTGLFSLGKVSGDSINFLGSITFTDSNPFTNSTIFDNNNLTFVNSYRDSITDFGEAVVLQSGNINITSENFIGFSNASYSDGQTATVQIIGSIDDAQSGLTAGQSYFVQSDGTLTESPGDPEVFAGTAMSDTDLLIKL